MAEINLLTKRLVPTGIYVSLSKALKIFAVIGTLLFFIAVAVMVGIYLSDSSTLKKSVNNQEVLKRSIKEMETTEIEYTVVKDRAKGISMIYDTTNMIDNMDNMLMLTDSIPEDTKFSSAMIDEESTRIAFVSPSSSNLVETFAKIVSTDRYKRVMLETFSFNPEEGYVIEIEMSGG